MTNPSKTNNEHNDIVWYSQFGQDKWLMKNVFQNKRNGFFLDCGCNHPLNLSNTFSLEKHFGWSGIGIDIQIQSDFPQKRPATIPFQACLSNKNGLVVDIIPGGGTTGIHDNNSNSPIRSNSKVNKSFKAITTTLTTILDVCGAPHNIDLFSLDVEGHEISILEGLDRDKYSIEYMCIETPYSTTDPQTGDSIAVGGGRERFFGFMKYIGYELVESPIASDTIWRLAQ